MVDINNSYSAVSNIDYCVASMNSYGNLNLDDIDCLENLDESDLLNFTTNCDEFNYSLLPDTPPETPINYNNSQANSPGQNLECSNLSGISSDSLSYDSTFANNHSNIGVSSNALANGAIIIPRTTIVHNPTTLSTTCIAPSLLINCQPALSTVDLNGFNLNGNSVLYPRIDTSPSNKNVQPKSILPNRVSPTMNFTKEIAKNQTLEARKLRNREAALNSRLKKKEYVDGLEASVKKLTSEKNKLLTENKVLKQRVKDLEGQLGNRLRLDINGNYESNKKAKISFFAVIFMVCFQVSPYLISIAPTSGNGTDLSTRPLAALPRANSHKIGRTLLWSSDSGEIQPDYYKMNEVKVGNYNSSSEQYANKSILCKDYFNVTESLRLENELRDWLTRFKLEQKQMQPKARRVRPTSSSPQAKQNNNKKLLFDSKYVPIPRLKLWMQKQKYGDYLPEEFDQNSEPLYGFDYESLLATVHRRDDTFYYLSYPSKGHLVLPPISNRTDVRPRFSFLIPTFNNLSLGDSPKNESSNSSVSPQMFILQIDCQVINTKVTLIKDHSRFGNKTQDKLVPNGSKKLYNLAINNGRK